MQSFAASLEHVLAELARLDLLLSAAVARARSEHATPDDGFQGLYISEREIDGLLARPAGLPGWAAAVGPGAEPAVASALNAMAAANTAACAEALRNGVELRLLRLADLCALTELDVSILLVALAPELDLRYERIYAYLQDDVTRKWPSVDLALNLLCPGLPEKIAARDRLAAGAPLLAHGLLQLHPDASAPHAPLLAHSLKVDPRIAGYLLGSDAPDERLAGFATIVTPRASLDDLLLPPEVRAQLAGLLAHGREPGQALVLYLQGPYGAGKQTVAEALAERLGLRLLVVDGARLASTPGLALAEAVQLAAREAALQNAALFWRGSDRLLADETGAWPAALWQALSGPAGYGGPAFLPGETAWEPQDCPEEVLFLRVELPRPPAAGRVLLWRTALGEAMPSEASATATALAELAGKFRMSPGQIRDAAATARGLAVLRDPLDARVTVADLQAACRLQSNRKLGELAVKIAPHYHWDDIVLPDDRRQQLVEIRNYVKHRAQVYDAWGFDRKLSLGKGLNVLFAGPSGTGKTMAADVIAGELGLDLYKIDLSTVVSKYIGETEKNLSRIFSEAETSNAILFFDEADALFGKRSEVRDAHDRYANIEIAYLLQKMDEYDGVVILATNLRKNLDEAFVRRMHFAVEFPFPSEADRRLIWEKIWPAETPRQAELDLGTIARRFELPGGNIRNIALAAAFLAADDGREVSMQHLLHATRREYQKMGKLAAEAEFAKG